MKQRITLKQKVTFWLVVFLAMSTANGALVFVREVVPDKQRFMKLKPCLFFSEGADPNFLEHGFMPKDVNDVYPELVGKVYKPVREPIDGNDVPPWDWFSTGYDHKELFAIAVAEMRKSRDPNRTLYLKGDEGIAGSVRFIVDEVGEIRLERLDNDIWQKILPDSVNIGSFLVGGNTAKTVITTQNTYVDLNLAGLAAEASDIELWSLTNTTTGELRYDGITPANLRCTGLVAAYSAGGVQRFNFRLLKNGLPLASPDNVSIPIEIRTTIASSPLLWSIEVAPNDLFRLQVENAGGVSDITIDTLKVVID